MENDINKQDEDFDGEEEQEMDEDEIRQKGDWNQQLLKACQKGDYDQAKRCLDKKASVMVECKRKWNPLIWASCKGHINIVRLLISRGAALQYTTQQQIQFDLTKSTLGPAYSIPNLESMNSSSLQADAQSKKVLTGAINNQIKQTPLQWACFKGHLQIVWLLLKAGLNWEDIDPYGNNCVHLAASGGSLAVFQVLLMFGIQVSHQNARGHTVKDLATNRDIIHYIKQLEINEQKDPHRKYWCMTSKEFFTSDEYKVDWVYESETSTEKEKPEGRCMNCWSCISVHTHELADMVLKQDHKLLTDKLNQIEGGKVEIELKTIEHARIQQEKLRTQNVILAHVGSLKQVDNYKTIMKSVNSIKEMLDDVKTRNVHIDQHVFNVANSEMSRLISERNLRFELDNLDIGQSVPEQVQSLQDKMADALEKGVAPEYLEHADVLKDKMARSIQAKKIVRLFSEYPLREYPEPYKVDPKTKKYLDPFTNKIIVDPIKLAAIALQLAPKKTKKKEVKFVNPEWANDLKMLEENVKGIELLIKDQKSLQLDQEFLAKSQDNIVRMKKEIYFRKQQDEAARLIAEAKALAKKKK